MKPIDVLLYAYSDFAGNRFKTLMSCLGIIIGVLAIVVMLTLGEGLYSGVSKEFGNLELDTIAVMPGNLTAGGTTAQSIMQKPAATLTDHDVSVLMGTPGVAEVDPEILLQGLATYKGQNKTASIVSIVPKDEARMSREIDRGRFLSGSDTHAVVLGNKVAGEAFGRQVNPGDRITLTNPQTGRSRDYTVVGILKVMEGSSLTGDPDSEIFMTHAGMKSISDQDTYTWIGVRADSVESVDTVAAIVGDSLKLIHKNEEFSVLTQKTFAESVQTIFNLLRYTLTGIGAVSLVVGGIGIVNVMMLSVRERVREIGLMKAVGATSSNVRIVFLAEASILGLASGLIGSLLAAMISAGVGSLAQLPMDITAQNLAIGIAFGLATTTIAGFLPADRAARLDPIEALRTE